jgi:hypothetical protein
LAGIATAFLVVFLSSKSFDAVVLREAGNPYVMTDEGDVRNLIRLKLTNRTDRPMVFHAKILRPAETSIVVQESEFQLAARETKQFHASVISPKTVFAKGKSEAMIEIVNQDGVSRTIRLTLLGPF